MSSASSHEIRANCPAPFGPTRFSGWSNRSGWCTRSAYRATFSQITPRVYVLRDDPRTRPMVRGSSRSTSSAQVLVQSWGHTEGTVSIPGLAMAPSIP